MMSSTTLDQPTNIPSVRDEMIQTAIKFLENPNVINTPLTQKQKFLQRKGLTDEEIQVACEKSGSYIRHEEQSVLPPLHSVVPGTISNYQPYQPNLTFFDRLRKIVHNVAIFSIVAYVIHKFYERYISPFLFGTKKSIEESFIDLDENVKASVDQLKDDLQTVKVEVHKVSQEFENRTNYQLTELKSEIASVKGLLLGRATRDSYGDEAIGYIQVKRGGTRCIVRSKITPERKVRTKPYRVEAEINESEETVVYCKCMDCAASKGGCKHSVAFLLWLHRRSEEPSVTSVECYWRVSKLSKVGTTSKFMTLDTLSSKPVSSLSDVPDEFLKEILEEGEKRGCQGTIFQRELGSDPVSATSIHKLCLKYKKEFSNLSAQGFLNFLEKNINETDCKSVRNLTLGQNKSTAWYEVRYGRITASKLYEASRCTTFAGSLVEEILGGGKLLETAAMSRGKTLEDNVLEKLSE